MNNLQSGSSRRSRVQVHPNRAFARLRLRWCDARTLTRGIRSTLKVMRIRCNRHTFAAPFPVWSALTARCDGPGKRKGTSSSAKCLTAQLSSAKSAKSCAFALGRVTPPDTSATILRHLFSICWIKLAKKKQKRDSQVKCWRPGPAFA